MTRHIWPELKPEPYYTGRLTEEHEWRGSEDPYSYSYPLADWYWDLADTSSMNTSPDTASSLRSQWLWREGLPSRWWSKGWLRFGPTATHGSSHKNVLTEVLQPGVFPSESLLPFNGVFTGVQLGGLAKPCTGTPVHRTIARCHCPAPGDPAFLSQHLTPESLVVQASTSQINPTTFPTTPPDRKSKRLDTI